MREANPLGNMQCPQKHLKTIVYAKFVGKTKCIMGNSKIENVLRVKLFQSPIRHNNIGHLRTFAPIVSAHPYCARKFTRHVIHERAR